MTLSIGIKYHPECRVLFIVMLNVTMLSVCRYSECRGAIVNTSPPFLILELTHSI